MYSTPLMLSHHGEGRMHIHMASTVAASLNLRLKFSRFLTVKKEREYTLLLIMCATRPLGP